MPGINYGITSLGNIRLRIEQEGDAMAGGAAQAPADACLAVSGISGLAVPMPAEGSELPTENRDGSMLTRLIPNEDRATAIEYGLIAEPHRRCGVQFGRHQSHEHL
jgi:hypothetical protein